MIPQECVDAADYVLHHFAPSNATEAARLRHSYSNVFQRIDADRLEPLVRRVVDRAINEGGEWAPKPAVFVKADREERERLRGFQNRAQTNESRPGDPVEGGGRYATPDEALAHLRALIAAHPWLRDRAELARMRAAQPSRERRHRRRKLADWRQDRRVSAAHRERIPEKIPGSDAEGAFETVGAYSVLGVGLEAAAARACVMVWGSEDAKLECAELWPAGSLSADIAKPDRDRKRPVERSASEWAAAAEHLGLPGAQREALGRVVARGAAP